MATSPQEVSYTTHFEMQPMSSILPFECHPNFRYITQETNKQSMECLGIKEDAAKIKFLQSRIGMIGSLMIPRGEDDEKLIFASKNILALFAVDDVFESNPQHARHLIETLIVDAQSPASNTDHHFQTYPLPWLFIRDLTRELRNKMSPSMFLRYLPTYIRYLLGVLDEVENHQDKTQTPDAEKYKTLRRQTIFIDGACILMAEFCMGIDLKSEIVESQDYINLCNAIIDHCALLNDLGSFRKEFYSGVQCNWVCVFVNQGMSLQQAVDTIYDMIHDTENKISELQKKLAKKAHATRNNDLLKFANASVFVASGNLRFCFITGRYHGYNNPLINGEPFHGTCLLHPEATIILQFNDGNYTHRLLMTD